MGQTRFIEHGQCPGTVLIQAATETSPIHPRGGQLSASFVPERSLTWECFPWQRPTGAHQRRTTFQLRTSCRTQFSANCANLSFNWMHTRPAADRASEPAAEPGPTSFEGVTSHGHATTAIALARALPSTGGLPADGAATPASALSAASSGLQHQVLLQLVGPSTSADHVTGWSILTQVSAALASSVAREPLPLPLGPPSSHRLAAPQPLSGDSHPPSSAVCCETHLPAQHLHAACLASVAAALVRLPQVYGEHGQGLPAMLLHVLKGSWVGPAAQQQPPPQQQLGASGAAVGAAALAGDQQLAAPSCRFDLTAGPRLAAGLAAPARALLATAPVAAGGPRVTEPSGVVAGCSSRNSGRGSSRGSSANSSTGPQGRVAAVTATAAAQGESLPAADAGGAKEQQEAAEGRPKMFDNPIRYAKLLFSGAMSAVVSRTCVAPLERIKMDLLLKNGTGDAATTAAQVLRTEGIAGFWKGNALNVLRSAPFKAVNFFSFDMYHTALLALWGRDGNTERFTAGACAGVTATLVCFPLDVVRTRLMASVAGPRYGTGPFTTLLGILRNEGAAALYSGCLPAVIGMAPAGAVFYGVYDMLKHRHLDSLAAAAAAADECAGEQSAVAAAAGVGASSGAPPAAPAVPGSGVGARHQQHHHQLVKPAAQVVAPGYTLLYGAMAGATSELIVYPLEVVRRKMQLQSMALAGLRQVGGAMSHMGNAQAAAAAAAAAAAMGGHHGTACGGVGGAAGGRLAAAAASHHLAAHPQLGSHHLRHLLPHQLLMALSSSAVANSPGLARVAAAVTAILRADGPRGFYTGLLPNMLQVLPSAALSYYTYDTLKTALGAR